MYAKLTRRQVEALLKAIEITHYDRLICHRDGSFTIKTHYFYRGGLILNDQRRRLREYTHATILHATENWMKKETEVEIRFAFKG